MFLSNCHPIVAETEQLTGDVWCIQFTQNTGWAKDPAMELIWPQGQFRAKFDRIAPSWSSICGVRWKSMKLSARGGFLSSMSGWSRFVVDATTTSCRADQEQRWQIAILSDEIGKTRKFFGEKAYADESGLVCFEKRLWRVCDQVDQLLERGNRHVAVMCTFVSGYAGHCVVRFIQHRVVMCTRLGELLQNSSSMKSPSSWLSLASDASVWL